MDTTKTEPSLVRIDGSTHAVTLYRKFVGIVAKTPAGGYEAMEWAGGSHCFDFKNKKEAVEWVIEMVPNAKSEPTARLFAQVGSTDGLCHTGDK